MIKTLACVTMLGLSALSFTVQSADLPDGPHVMTSGYASVDATPDIASLSIEVNVSANTAAEAKKQADSRVREYFNLLLKQGIQKPDIDAANLRTEPEYDYSKGGKSHLKGYRATRQVKVTLRKLDMLSDLLDGALKAGLNEIHSIQLGVANPQQYRDNARELAIKDAINQASVLAKGFNAKLGPVYSIRYHGGNYQSAPVMRVFATAASNSASETYEQQSIHFDDRVDVVFQLNLTQ